MENLKVLVEVSARHIHLSTADLETLFGAGYQLTHKKDLSQPGQFACEERVGVVGPKGTMSGVSILGPVRKDTQLEVSLADARTLGVKAPIRESGDVAGSAGFKLTGPKGEIELAQGAIVAKRHVHVTPADAATYGLSDKEIVQVRIGGDRGLIFDEVVIRVGENFATAMHIDVDEANGAQVGGVVYGEIIKK